MQKQSLQTMPRCFAPIDLELSFPINHFFYTLPETEIASLHLHDCLELGLCLRGSGIFVVEDRVFPFQTGDISVIASSEFHRAQSSPKQSSDWYFFQFPPSFPAADSTECELRFQHVYGGPDHNILSGAEHPFLRAALEQLRLELSNRPPAWKDASRGLLQWIMTELSRITAGSAPLGVSGQRRIRNIERLAPSLQWIAAHYRARELNVAVLAKACYLSEPHFRRIFEETFGKTPWQYLTDYRIHLGMHLLRTKNLDVMSAAQEVGYANPSTFYRHFKALYGVSPKQYAMGK